jgi:LacI family transcriptional regulator
MPDPPDAVFVTNNLMSVGAIQWLTAAGLSPPAVGIMSFGAPPFATHTPAGVFVVDIPNYALGERAAKLLIERIAGAPGPARTIVLPTVDLDQADARRYLESRGRRTRYVAERGWG